KDVVGRKQALRLAMHELALGEDDRGVLDLTAARARVRSDRAEDHCFRRARNVLELALKTLECLGVGGVDAWPREKGERRTRGNAELRKDRQLGFFSGGLAQKVADAVDVAGERADGRVELAKRDFHNALKGIPLVSLEQVQCRSANSTRSGIAGTELPA